MPSELFVKAKDSATYRISSDRGPASAQELVELARALKLELKACRCSPPVWTTYSCITPATGWRRRKRPPLPPAERRKGARDEASFGFGGARYAQVPPQPGVALRLAGDAAAAVDHPGQRLRRQYQKRHPGRGQPRSGTGIGGCAGARPRRGRKRPHLSAHRLRRPGRRPQRPAQGRAGRRF